MLVAGDVALHTANCLAAGAGMNCVNGNPIDTRLTRTVRFDRMPVAGDMALHTANSLEYVDGNPIDTCLTQTVWFD